MRGYIHYVREKGLRMSAIGALHHLKLGGHVGVSDVGEHLGVSNAAASQMLDRLVEEGMISRTEDPNDRRMKRLTITDAGINILEEAVNARVNWLKDLGEKLTEEEKEQLSAAMRLMIAKTQEI
jgi:DNA-binding MarR family transcriptional regulator